MLADTGYSKMKNVRGPLRSQPEAGRRETAAEAQRLRLDARRELGLARQATEDAVRYQQVLATRARSEVQQLVLKARLATNREIEVLRQAGEEIQKILADMSVIRVAAQEELAALRRLTDAARLCLMNSGIPIPPDTPHPGE